MNFVEKQNFLNEVDCRYVISAALPKLVISRVAGNEINSIRTSSQCLLDIRSHTLLDIEHKLELLLGIPSEYHETWRVIRYRVGEYYKAHHDWIHENQSYSKNMLSLGGQRIKTVIIFLCNVVQGGETFFPLVFKKFIPELGKLLAWDNVDSNGKPLLNTLHEGLPPINGEKWILTTWYREHPIFIP